MKYKIYPPIGIARIGNSPTEFFIGPEIEGRPGVEINSQGQEVEVQKYKVDDDEIKRQAARFRIFEFSDANSPGTPINLPPGASVEWTVHLVNKKAAVVRPQNPPTVPKRPVLAPNSAALIIDPQTRTISGVNTSGVRFDTGQFQGRQVPLGEIRTDAAQNLIVLGGFGFSTSPMNTSLQSFYKNPGWHDDVSDGPVSARIRMPDGSIVTDVEPAWVVVAPPDFAPFILGVATLYDILLDLGIQSLGIVPPASTSFTNHIYPLLKRTRQLQWVNGNPNWESVSDDWTNLADVSAANQDLRINNAELVRNIESILDEYRLTNLQNKSLADWENGTFVNDWAGEPVPGNEITQSGLTRAALDGTVGQGFFPGIEAGVLLKDPTLYSTPFDFRLKSNELTAGDLTALMAQPWQADFFACRRGWWPSQRPDEIRTDPNDTQVQEWDRGITKYLGMVHNFAKLGLVTPQRDNQGRIVFVEEQRAADSEFF